MPINQKKKDSFISLKIDDNSRFKHYIVDLILYCHIKDFCDFLIKIICLLKLYIIYLIFHYNLIHNK